MRFSLKNLGTHCVAAKFMPCLLNEDQKQYCVEFSKELVDHENADKNFLKVMKLGFMAMISKQKPRLHNRSQKHHPDPKKHSKFSPI
jgi:hypothetical protein